MTALLDRRSVGRTGPGDDRADDLGGRGRRLAERPGPPAAQDEGHHHGHDEHPAHGAQSHAEVDRAQRRRERDEPHR